MSDKLPGRGVFGWLGRQVGYVKKAVTTQPVATPPAKRSAPQSPPFDPAPPAGESSDGIVYRQDQVQEAEHPSQPGVKLRRTIIDEVIVEQDSQSPDGKT